jgi:hypothetical protein
MALVEKHKNIRRDICLIVNVVKVNGKVFLRLINEAPRHEDVWGVVI